MTQAGGSVVSSGRAWAGPLAPCGLEARLAAGLEHDDLCRARRLLGAGRDPNEVQVHLVPPLCCGDISRRPRSEGAAEPLRPATIVRGAGLPGVEPGPARLELAVLPFTPQAFESGRPGSNGPPRTGAPVLFRLSYVRVIRPAGVEPAASAVARQRSRSAELRACVVRRLGCPCRSPALRPWIDVLRGGVLEPGAAAGGGRAVLSWEGPRVQVAVSRT